MVDCHPERSEAESKDPAEITFSFATGFLDFARNDSIIPCLGRISYPDIQHER
jgi:hypothetical protein